MHLHYYPNEDAFIGRVATLDEFRNSDTWSTYEAHPSVQVTARDAVTGGTVPRPDWCEPSRQLVPYRLYHVKDVYYFPWSGVVVSSDGGIFTATSGETVSMGRDMAFLPYCKTDGLETLFFVPHDIQTIDRLAITLPFGAGPGANYGHFLLDGLSAASTFQELGLLADRTLGTPELKPWQARHFELIGLTPTILSGYVYRVNDAIFASGMDHNLHRPNVNYRPLRDKGLANHAPTTKDLPKRVYLSRGGKTHRVNRSEDHLQARLASFRFAIVDPATLTVDDQIALFNSAEVIVGCTGAAFANALYAKPSALVIDIQPVGMHYAWVQDLCAIVGCRYAAFLVEGTITHESGSASDGAVFDVDVEHFLAFLHQRMVAEAPPSLGAKVKRLFG